MLAINNAVKRQMSVDFCAQLKRQLRFLKTSAAAFDAGDRDEAIRIGTGLRVLFHQTNRSTSLMRHLDAESFQILSTSARTPVGPGMGLNVANHFDMNVFTGVTRAMPWLDAAPTKMFVPLADWWKAEVVLFNTGIEVTRRDLALWAANQDGGAHVDDTFDVDYEKVVRGLDFTYTITKPDGYQLITRVEELHLAALRQFAYEVLCTPALVKLGNRK